MKLRKDETGLYRAYPTVPSVKFFKSAIISNPVPLSLLFIICFTVNIFGKCLVFMIGLVLRQVNSSRPNET